MFKRFLALLICVLTVLPVLASCDSDDATPEGMQSVTLNGEPFVFYVPETWTDNRDSGISSAYYSLNKGIMATAKHFPCDKETIDAGIEAYVNNIKEQNSVLLKDKKYTVKDEGGDRLSGLPAQKYIYSYNYDGDTNNLTVAQYYTFHNGSVILLSMYAMSEYYSEATEDFAKIKNNFILCEKKVSDRVEIDEDTPSGMKKASSDDVQYACYVPKSWVTNLDNKMTFAYYDESGKPNVSVTCHSPDQDVTVQQYYEILKANYAEQGYKLVGEPTKLKVADRDSISFDYIITTGTGENQTRYKLRQVVIGYNSLMYSITYTAREDRFDAHLNDVNSIIQNFRFR